MELVADTVYARLNSVNVEQRGLPSIDIVGTTIVVEMYASNDVAQPVDKTQMRLANTFTEEGIYAINTISRWILFSYTTGTPTVYDIGVVKA